MSKIKTYFGHLIFSGFEQATTVRGFTLLPNNMILLDLTEKRDNEIVRFLGVAEYQPYRNWRTPWVYLAAPYGDNLEADEDYVQITVSTLIPDGQNILIEGTWVGSDEELHPFKATLHSFTD